MIAKGTIQPATTSLLWERIEFPESCRSPRAGIAALQSDGFSGEQQHPSQHRPKLWSIFFRKCTGKVGAGIGGFLNRNDWLLCAGLDGVFGPEYAVQTPIMEKTSNSEHFG
jgi:hypothetical protein